MKKVTFLHKGKPITDEDVLELIKSDSEIEPGFYYFIRLLEFNNTFKEWLTDIRAKYEIPIDGLGYSYKLTYIKPHSASQRDSGYDYEPETTVEAKITTGDLGTILAKVRFEYRRFLVSDQLMSIVVRNAVEIPLKRSEKPITEYSSIGEVISYALSNPAIKKKELTDHLWEIIEAERYKIAMTSKDLALLELRDNQNKSFPEIADELSENKTIDVDYTYDTATIAYHRAKERAEKLLD